MKRCEERGRVVGFFFIQVKDEENLGHLRYFLSERINVCTQIKDS